MRAVPWVATAGALGAVCRFLLDALVVRRAGPPWGTTTVNVLGSLGAGLVAGAASRGLEPELHVVLATGFLGAFTTFSTWMVQTVALVEDGELRLAGASLGSLLAGVLAALAGLVLAA